jgi:hypothetical protein
MARERIAIHNTMKITFGVCSRAVCPRAGKCKLYYPKWAEMRNGDVHKISHKDHKKIYDHCRTMSDKVVGFDMNDNISGRGESYFVVSDDSSGNNNKNKQKRLYSTGV